MKKLWTLIALFVILFPLIVACGDDDKEEATAIPAPTKEEVTVVCTWFEVLHLSGHSKGIASANGENSLEAIGWQGFRNL